jgi:cation diffusion facilitator CzcD-associated flavoprotein CzcO
MPPRHSSIAVIGAGPSGISAIKALTEENIFSKIRLFERRHKVGGTWIYDAEPAPFTASPLPPTHSPPASFPAVKEAAPEDLGARTGVYEKLDTNVGAEVMAFTHTPFPMGNSAQSVQRLGENNPSKSWRTVAKYLEDIAKPYMHLIELNTHVESVRKFHGKWVVTLRKTAYVVEGEGKGEEGERDYWWQEEFDAVIVASGHYNIPNIPDIPGLKETSKLLPEAFEHAKAYRFPRNYANKASESHISELNTLV